MYGIVYTEGEGPVFICMGSIQSGGVDTKGAKFCQLVVKIDLSETTQSHMFNLSLRLNKHK